MNGKRVQDSIAILTQVMRPQDANWAGNVHGGSVMHAIDTVANIVASRHCRTNAVTASVDRLDFLFPVYVGDIVTFKASLNYVGTTSMEVGVCVEAENRMTGEIRHTASAYLTMVALDANQKPVAAPPLVLETETDRRRNSQAKARRAMRLQEKKSKQ